MKILHYTAQIFL